MKKYKNMIEFSKDFHTKKQCLAFLCEEKWGNGFQCNRCGNEAWNKGRTWYYRRCKSCNYDESCTAHTLFHKLKFPLVNAFWIVFQLSTLKKGMSTCELARQFSVSQKTAWYFKRKVQQAIDSKEPALLQTNVEVDEFVIGGAEKGMPGRSHGKKVKIQVALEIDYPDHKHGPVIKNAAARVIHSYDAKELGRGIDEMVDKDSVVVTDKWSAYPKATKGRWHLSYPSDKGKNFILLHWHIFNLKNWIRGIHHKVSIDHVQRYLNEYHYRFNRRNNRSSCPMGILKRMIEAPWMPYQMAIAS